jgi:dihydrofolate reductase
MTDHVASRNAMSQTASPPQLSVFIATSLDGRIAAADGNLDWLTGAARPDEDYGYDDLLSSVDALAMGRGTYDHIAELDPLPFQNKPLYVFTHNPPPARNKVTFCSQTPRDAVTAWTSAGHRHVYVDGGRLISDFLAEDLIDTLTITTVPRILGGGPPLFHPHLPDSAWSLVTTRSYPSGLVTSSYARPPHLQEGLAV